MTGFNIDPATKRDASAPPVRLVISLPLDVASSIIAQHTRTSRTMISMYKVTVLADVMTRLDTSRHAGTHVFMRPKADLYLPLDCGVVTSNVGDYGVNSSRHVERAMSSCLRRCGVP